jgi:hypothetical protein
MAQGNSVALSAEGNMAAVGGPGDNQFIGAVWIFERFGTIWLQRGQKLAASTAGFAAQGASVALSPDTSTLLVGGYFDDNNLGAAWVWVRNPAAGTWSLQAKLLGLSVVGAAQQGYAVSLSGDGNTAIVGGYSDNNNNGAAWVFARSPGGLWYQQGPKLMGTGATPAAQQAISVALSADGNTAMIGGNNDGNVGAAWVFTRSDGLWIQQGQKLVGTGAVGSSNQGESVALSSNGRAAMVGGGNDGSGRGAVWAFSESTAATSHDFNGDGTSDILWRDTNGNISIWLMSGATVSTVGGLVPGVSNEA